MIKEIKHIIWQWRTRIKSHFWAKGRKKMRVVLDTNIVISNENRILLESLAPEQVFVPRAVRQQLTQMVEKIGTSEASTIDPKELAQAETFVYSRIAHGWEEVGSSRTGLLQSIENQKLGELNFSTDEWEALKRICQKKQTGWNNRRQAIGKEKVKFDNLKCLTLKDLLGSTDLRIIATCLHLLGFVACRRCHQCFRADQVPEEHKKECGGELTETEKEKDDRPVFLVTRDKVLTIVAKAMGIDVRQMEDL